MDLQIRDVQTSDTFSIPASGQIFGRAGPKADIVVPDRTVSSKHARIYSEGGVWFLEDLRSSNGTFVEGERIDAPVRLTPGMRFAFCRYAYEVVASMKDSAGAATSVLENAQITTGDPTVSGPGHPRAVEESPRGPRRDPTTADGPRTYGNERTAAPHAGGGGFAYFLATVPKAAAYYMAAVPVMLFNPIGTVRKGIAEPKFGALGTKELIAYALPSYILFVLLGSIGGILVTIVHGGFGFGTIMAPLISLAVGIVVSVVMGFIFHPVMRWLVRILKGESDEVSRSNYFVMLFTAYPIVGVATLLSVVIGLIPVPFLGILPVLIGVGANLLLAFIAFSWFIHFRVMKWFPILILIGGVASCVGGLLGVVNTIRADIAGLGSGGSDVADGEVLSGEELAAALAAGDISPEEAAEMSRRAAEAAVAAANDAAQAAEHGDAAGAAEAGAEAAAAAGTDATGAVDDAATAAATAVRAADSAGDASAVAAGATVAEVAPAEGNGTPPPRTDETRYERFIRRRAAVEETIERNPMLMSRKDIRPLYKEMHKITFKVQKKHKVKTGKKATPDKLAEKKIADRMREAETYQLTSKIVDTLYEKVVEGR